jgi:catechol 2,3-dioxygenase-like lactoylglutathione lyase family enzyme
MRSVSEATQAPFVCVDHVQLSIPPDGEERARRFYRDLLGLQEVERPPDMANRGGAWFGSGGVAVHLGVEQPFQPAKKAHPAFVCANYESLLERLRDHDVPIAPAGTSPEGKARCHVSDPFGNRIELIAS